MSPLHDSPPRSEKKRPLEAFQVAFLVLALIVVPAAFTLNTVQHPGRLEIGVEDPTPLGYSVSLLLFLMPLAALGAWFARRRDLHLVRRAFWRTIAVLVPLGFVLDLLFGNAFFTFPNRTAVIGLYLPAVGEPIPVEEFVFYLSGFFVVLLTYIWADEYWLAAYNLPDYEKGVAGLPRIVGFHWPSLAVGAGLLAAAVVYKKVFSQSPDGFPWYATYLIAVSIVPSVGFFRTAQPFINWRAFIFTSLFILLISLLWEATLGVPYGWWGYRPAAMMGFGIGAWSGLPLEAVCVWLAVSYTTVICYEVVKIWMAMGRPARSAFLGVSGEAPSISTASAAPPASALR
jgi:hypothetical protein